VHALHSLGASVVGVDVAPARTEQFNESRNILDIEADLSLSGAAAEVVEEAVAHFGRLDLLVNNAALTGSAAVNGYAVDLASQTEGAWEQAIRLNLTVPFLLCQAASPFLERSDHASIINIGSIYASLAPDPGLYRGTDLGNPAAYGASKAGLLQLTRHLAAAFGPKIRVNAVSPGGISRGQDPVFVERYVGKVPLDRMATEDEIVGPILFLASRQASYITGQELLVDGGFSAW
jgi:NAD(P)-dependent dehydrogenase (short-subunit alcohol dehydrogenase family)